MDPSSEAARNNAASALMLYKGSFLSADLDAPWSAPMRERLRTKFIGLVSKQGQQLEAGQQYAAAVSLYERGLDADNLVEEFHQGLMRCYARLNRNAEALAVYVRLKQLLSLALGVQPSNSTQVLYRSLRT